MTPKERAQHKTAANQLRGMPVFKPLKRSKLPVPLHKVGSTRIMSTDLMAVSDTHRVVLMRRSMTPAVARSNAKLAASKVKPRAA